MIEAVDEVPICDVCSHRHVLGEKCSICGHVGQSQVFQRMVEAAAIRRHVSIRLVNRNEPSQWSPELELMVHELQRRDATEQQQEQEQHPQQQQYGDNGSPQIFFVAYKGNAPVGYLTLTYAPEPGRAVSFIVKRAYVLPRYRGQQIALRMLSSCFSYIQMQQSIPRTALYVPLPPGAATQWMTTKFHGFVAVAQALARVTSHPSPLLIPPSPSAASTAQVPLALQNASPSSVPRLTPSPAFGAGGVLLSGDCSATALSEYVEIIARKLVN